MDHRARRRLRASEVSSPRAGGAYTERVLDILTRNPAVWSRCVFFVTYDENDCFYDHVPPPAHPRATTARDRAACPPWSWTASTTTRTGPSAGTPDDPAALHGRAFGMGPRVPMLVVSPWSRGGWVNAQVFDHTSVIRFLEARHGVMEPNISAWRRAVAGDLTSALDFSGERDHPDEPPGDAIQTRRSCALPYALETVGRMTADGESYRLTFRNPAARARCCMYDLDLAAPPAHAGRGSRLDDGWRCRLAATTDCGCWARTDSTANSEAAPRTAACSRRSWCRSARPAPATDQLWRGAPAHESGIAHRRRLARGGACRPAARSSSSMPAAKAGTTWRSPCQTCRRSDAGWRVIASGKPGVPDPRLRRGWTLTPWTGRD